jgi:hypothetical protein
MAAKRSDGMSACQCAMTWHCRFSAGRAAAALIPLRATRTSSPGPATDTIRVRAHGAATNRDESSFRVSRRPRTKILHLTSPGATSSGYRVHGAVLGERRWRRGTADRDNTVRLDMEPETGEEEFKKSLILKE